MYKKELHCKSTGSSCARLVLLLGVPFGKCQRGEFVYLLWNVPIQILVSTVEEQGLFPCMYDLSRTPCLPLRILYIDDFALAWS